MKNDKQPCLFAQYIKQNIVVILFFTAAAFISVLVFYLYELPVEAVVYAIALCLLLAAIIIPFRYYRYYRRHRDYMNAMNNIRLMINSLPDPETLTEYDSRNIISELAKELENSLNEYENDRNESIDFYTTWVHQIKTPISVMRMILESEDTDEHRELMAELFRIEQYAEMVLTYLRLGSETSDYVFKEYDIDGIIKQAIRKYAPLFIRRKIKIEYKPVHARILTDEKWLLFIIEQVLSNSAKYTFEGSVTVSFTKNEMLKISDTGIGIAPEDLPRIFEKGFTGYNGRSDKKSTGLGLYLCKTASDKLGNKIYAESSAGKGTTISIDLHKEKIAFD